MIVADGETSPNVGRGGAPTANIMVAGPAGRMGSRIIACLPDAPDLRLVGALEASGHASLGRDAGELAGVGRAGVTVDADAAALVTRDRVLIEFSVPDASLAHLRLVAQAGGPGGGRPPRLPPPPRAGGGGAARGAGKVHSPTTSPAPPPPVQPPPPPAQA